MNAIEVKHITKRFDEFAALTDVNLNVAQGELIALLGPSGSGKTTLLRIIAGLEFADSGEVLIEGSTTSQLNVRQREVGFVFQHYALFKHMTVYDNVAFGLRVRPKARRPSEHEIERRVMELLELVHLGQFYDRYPSQLSGGQRQRVALARALAVEPKLLLLDEPFGALDAKVRKELRRWLRRLHDEIHITSIFVTHDQEEAMEVADRVVVMNKGCIEQVGSPEEVYHKPANGFIYDFLGNYNEFLGWRDTEGNVHLAEDDMIASHPRMRARVQHTQPSLLGRYPGVGKLLRRVVPGAAEQPAPPQPVSLVEQLKKIPGTPVKLYCRPHELFITRTAEEGTEYIPAKIIHINPAGSLAKLELQRKNGTILQAEVPKAIVDSLNVKKHDTLLVKPKNTRVFE